MEYIIDYFEDNLESEKESILFSNLAYDENLRSEFKNFIKLNGLITKSVDNFVPSTEMTSSIFQTLGYQLPPVTKSVFLSNTAIYKSPFFKFLLTGISSAVAAAIITILIIGNNQVNTHYTNDTNNGKTDSYFNKDEIKNNSSQNSKNDLGKNYITGNQIKEKDHSFNKIGYIDIVNNVDNSDNTDHTDNTDKIDPVDKYLTVDSSELQRNSIISEQITSSSEITKIEVLEIESKNKQELNIFNNKGQNLFKFEFRNSLNWNLPTETIYPSETSKLNNLGISLFYNILKDFQIGLDLRQETFFTKYDGYDENGLRFSYSQHPNFTSIGLLFRYNLINEDEFAVYIQNNFSGNEFGFITRGLCGFDYFITDIISFLIQLEYSAMFFNHLDKSFNSRKATIQYVIIFSF